LGNSYGPYGPNQAPAPLLHPQQRVSSFGNSNQSQQHYKTPTILRNKDIDDLSKLTDNVTWASASQEVNYEEKIRFSDDEDNDMTDSKSRRYNNSQQSRQTYPQVLQNNSRSLHSTTRSRLLQDDEHVKQMQDDKNSELINTLTIAKQRRDEQERHLRDTIRPEQKQIPGYQTRPLITSTGQENLSSSSSQLDWGKPPPPPSTTTTATSRTRHDTTDSQTFAMKSWSDQMDSFNYASLHEKSGEQIDNDDTTNPPSSSITHKYSRSQSESSSQSQIDSNRSKHFPLTNRKQQKTKTTRIKTKTTDVNDYFDHHEQPTMKSNDQWGDWEDSNFQTNNRYQQQYSHDRRYQQISDESNRPKQSSNKSRSNASRSSNLQSSSSKSENKIVSNNNNNKPQPAWRALSPTRPLDPNDPTPQEAISYKPKTNDMNDRRQSAPIERKQRYPTTINTSSIPPLMSVRSDVPPISVSSSATTPTTASKHFKTSNQSQRQDYNTSSHYSQRNDFYNEANDSTWGNDDEYYDDETGYYDPNLPTHQRHHHYHSHLHHRGYITLGSYGRYRRGGTLRQYNTYNTNNTSSQLNTSTGSKTKKNLTNSNNKKTNESSEPTKPVVETPKILPDESIKKPVAWTNETKSSTIEEIPVIKLIETPLIPTGIEKPKDLISEQKTENESNVTIPQIETESTTTYKKNTSNNSQRKTNKDQQNYHQDQRYQNHYRNTYSRSMQGKYRRKKG
jgi:hypothetical protein